MGDKLSFHWTLTGRFGRDRVKSATPPWCNPVSGRVRCLPGPLKPAKLAQSTLKPCPDVFKYFGRRSKLVRARRRRAWAVHAQARSELQGQGKTEHPLDSPQTELSLDTHWTF